MSQPVTPNSTANRYVRLTESGLRRFQDARRRRGITVDALAAAEETPSVNTIKKALRRDKVFLSTLERLWHYLRLQKSGDALPLLTEGDDYVFVEAAAAAELVEPRRGWISSQVPHHNRLFTGRRDTLEHLRIALTAGTSNSGSDPQALSGLGGIGKTQTALTYLYKYRYDYRYLLWVNAETVASLTEGLANLAAELQLVPAGGGAHQDALAKMYHWFRDQSGWLLVLDNADDLAILVPHFPHTHSGHLLLTTRAHNTVRWAAPLPLRPLEPEEGARLLLRRAGTLRADQALTDAAPETVAAAQALSDALGGLPLALSQAGAYLAETMTVPADYLTLYRTRGLELLDRVGEPDHAPVTITFRLALERMERGGPHGAAAADLLRLCAFLEPDALPESVVAGFGVDARTAVCAYSLMAGNGESRTFSVHRLVQQAVRATVPVGEHRAWKDRAVRAVADVTPDFAFGDWALCELLLPHWRVCAGYLRDVHDEDFIHSQAVHLLYQAGRYLRARAQYDEAATFLQAAVSFTEAVHGPVHEATADCLDEMACLYREIDRADEAEPLHRRALAITEQTAGSESEATAAKLHNLALFYTEQKAYDYAEALFLRSLAVRETHPDAPLLKAATLTQLAGVYRYQNAFARAEPLFRRALALYEAGLPPDHIDIATACNNLGLLCAAVAQYAEAERLFGRALRINESARGDDHPETGTVVWSLAWVRWKQHLPDEADPLFQRAVRIYTTHFGPTHGRVVRLLGQYADFQNERNG